MSRFAPGMAQRYWPIPALILSMLVCSLTVQEPAQGCAPAYRTGAKVRIASESALIIWDAATKTEHFIRRGAFDSSDPDFGFLVPTPAEPVLADVDDALFDQLEEWTKPEEVVRHITMPPPGRGFPAMKAAAGAAAEAPDVLVLGEQRVAGFDAVKLKASDTKALLDWLKKHGYNSRPALEDWLKRYVEDGWVITAFKIAAAPEPAPPPGLPVPPPPPAGAPGAGAPGGPGGMAAGGEGMPGMGGPGRIGRPGTRAPGKRLATKALRMTFTTDKPFYPYREPEDMRSPGVHPNRLLRLFVLASERMDASIGKAGAPWPGTTVWANPTDESRRNEILDKVKIGPGGMPEQPWLTVSEDRSSPRPGTDELYFSRAADQSTLKRPPIYRDVYVPAPVTSRTGELLGRGPMVGILGLAGGFGLLMCLGLVVWFIRSGRAE